MASRISYDEALIKASEIKEALNVTYTQYSDPFLMDNWDKETGLTYLTGAYSIDEITDGSSLYILVRTLDCYSYNSNEFDYITNAFVSKYNRFQTIWDSGHHANLNPPSYYIDWAISKRIDIPWLDDVIEQGFYKPKQTNKDKSEIEKPINKRTENNYLRLILSLAMSIKDFNPQKPYEAAKLIIDETGIDIGKQTISDYITKAYELEIKKRD